jgi:hypothetical protein
MMNSGKAHKQSNEIDAGQGDGKDVSWYSLLNKFGIKYNDGGAKPTRVQILSNLSYDKLVSIS